MRTRRRIEVKQLGEVWRSRTRDNVEAGESISKAAAAKRTFAAANTRFEAIQFCGRNSRIMAATADGNGLGMSDVYQIS